MNLPLKFFATMRLPNDRCGICMKDKAKFMALGVHEDTIAAVALCDSCNAIVYAKILQANKDHPFFKIPIEQIN